MCNKNPFFTLFRFLEEQSKKAKGRENVKKTQGSNDHQGRVKGQEGEVSLSSFLRMSPFLSTDGGEEEEKQEDEQEEEEEGEEEVMAAKPPLKVQDKSWQNEEELAKLMRAGCSARQLFEERCAKRPNAGVTEEDHYLCQKLNYPAAIAATAAALSRRELAEKFDEAAPAARKMDSSSCILPAVGAGRNSDRDMFVIRREDSPLIGSRQQEAKVNVRMDFLRDSLLRWASPPSAGFTQLLTCNDCNFSRLLFCGYRCGELIFFHFWSDCSSADILASERQLSQDLMHTSRRDSEFRSIFHHVQNAQLQRSPSELFAQHIVTIVHHIKGESSRAQSNRHNPLLVYMCYIKFIWLGSRIP